MLTIHNPKTNRQTDYSRHYLQAEARRIAKLAPQSDGKLRAWSIFVSGDDVVLRVDYLTTAGNAETFREAL